MFLKLNERTEIANSSNADLFISIHCDGFTNPNPSGASVFVMGMSKLKENMDVAMRENAAIYLEDNYKQTYDGFDPKSPESYIVFSLMQNTYLNQSLMFAEEVEFSSQGLIRRVNELEKDLVKYDNISTENMIGNPRYIM